MKLGAMFANFLFALSAFAQDITSMPQCAQSPVLEAISSSKCGLTDVKCICTDKDFVSGLLEKIPKVCSPEDFAAATKVAVQLCNAYGASLSLPASPTTSASSGSSSATATATGSTASPNPDNSGSSSGSSANPPAATFTDAAVMNKAGLKLAGLIAVAGALAL
ncbi:hypothetical protein D8B26_002410 [Coccidioides posadasii str. Silveira]|uniref:CFEM domain-containing protein n=1 Tax=Coccidioides posadasii RMSCC 3488 TaxID=454284 RepID=A0A0J6FA50_COCPO|nr:hypothetical protein CPAG_02177 [Coccidioides posadasii RMSCC 3488]QVM07719.1 hypothetical protein D8B26_002410 [Coccidioides posadasii str. Silveira]